MADSNSSYAQTIRAEELTAAHTLLDKDGLMYTVSDLAREGDRVRFTATHIYNDMMAQQIRPQAADLAARSLVKVLAVEPQEIEETPGKVLVFQRPASGKLSPLDEGIEDAASRALERIRALISEGVSVPRAFRQIKRQSALGPMVWRAVIQHLPAYAEDEGAPHVPQCMGFERVTCRACNRCTVRCESARCTRCTFCGNDLDSDKPAKRPMWCEPCGVEHGDALAPGVVFAHHAEKCGACGKAVLSWAMDAHRAAKHPQVIAHDTQSGQDRLPTGPRDASAEVLKLESLFEQILNTRLPAVRDRQNRNDRRKEIARDIRALLASLKIKGISVTTPNHSMAQSVRITLPVVRGDESGHDFREHDYRDHHVYNCRHCHLRERASKHLEKIILAAFPSLDNRSDTMTDYFDYRLSIH